MKRIRLLSGIKWALVFLAVNVLGAIGAYFVVCSTDDTFSCSYAPGIYWIRMHPVFPNLIVYFSILGFVIGTFAHVLPEMPSALKNIKGWVVVILLIAAFALWAMPVLPG